MALPKLFVRAATPIASIFLILAGVIQLRAQIWTIGAICLALALLGFILSMRLLEKAPFTSEEVETLRPLLGPMLSWVTIISLLMVSVFYVADNFISARTNRIAAIAWVSSVLLGMLVVWGWQSWSSLGRTLIEKVNSRYVEVTLLLMVVILAIAVRTIDITSHPYPWSGDELSIGTEGRRILSGEITNFFETGWSSQPNWSFLPTAVTELIFGENIFAIRLPSVLAGTLAVLLVYLAARELFNPATALMSAAFLATLPYNVHFSRVGVNNVLDSLMSALLFWLIARGMKTNDPRYYYTAGAVGGLCIYTYAGTRLVLILAGLMILFLIIRQRSYLFSHWRHLVGFAAGVLVSAAPQAAFFARHPDIFIGRLGQEGILFNGWLTQQAAQTGKSVWDILLSQFTRTVMVFVASPAPGNFFNSPSPYLTVLGSILFLLGMGYALAFALQPRYFILLIWFWAVILFGGILTLNPPANTRMLMTSPPVAIFMALGAYKILEYLQRFRIVPPRLVAPILILAVGVITVQNVNFYMVEYKNNSYFQDANGEFAMEIALFANARGKDFHIYVLGAPRIFSGFPSFAFLAPQNPRADLFAEGIPALQIPSGSEAGFFAIPENRLLLEQIRQRYPGGESGLVYRKTAPSEILFEYYIVKP